MILLGEIQDSRAIINLEIEGVHGLVQIPITLDTGFNGELMLTSKTIKDLNPELLGHQGFFVASGD